MVNVLVSTMQTEDMIRGGFKAESLLGHPTKRGSSHLLSTLLPFPPLQVGPSNPDTGSGEHCKLT